MATASTQNIAEERSESAKPLRFVTAASLFDGHDAAINVMRRLIQAQGAEVIHLGHNRGVREIVRAAIQEDADGIAISSYQGGHIEYFRYMVDMLRENGAGHIRVFGGGGGTITPEEIDELAGLRRRAHLPPARRHAARPGRHDRGPGAAHAPTCASAPVRPDAHRHRRRDRGGADALGDRGRAVRRGRARAPAQRMDAARRPVPVVGITGTGGAGKSSVTDELLARFLRHFPELRIAVLAVDPTRRRTGGALLGDRIRMNSLRLDAHLHALDGDAAPAPRHQRDARRRRACS